MTQYKHLITGGLQMFFVHYGSILHLKINAEFNLQMQQNSD